MNLCKTDIKCVDLNISILVYCGVLIQRLIDSGFISRRKSHYFVVRLGCDLFYQRLFHRQNRVQLTLDTLTTPDRHKTKEPKKVRCTFLTRCSVNTEKNQFLNPQINTTVINRWNSSRNFHLLLLSLIHGTFVYDRSNVLIEIALIDLMLSHSKNKDFFFIFV